MSVIDNAELSDGFDLNSNVEQLNVETFDDVSVDSVSLIRYNQDPKKCLVSIDANESLAARLSKYCLKEEMADVHFIVSDNGVERKVAAHKLILSIRSDVFKAMFYGLWNAVSEIALPDIGYTVLTKLLTFIYTDEVSLDAYSLAATLYAAKKYQIYNLEKLCINYLTWNLNNENVLDVLSAAMLYNELELVSLCLEKLYANTEKIINSSTFVDIDYNTLITILKQDELMIYEVDLYKAVILWSCKECERRGIDITADNQRKVLGEALYHIRFPLMTGEEFAFYVVNQRILNNEEEMSVFLHFAMNTECKIFSSTPRSPPLKAREDNNKEFTLIRFPKIEAGRICMFDQIHKVDFLVSKPIYITGFGVYGTRCPDGDRILNVELVKSDTNENIASAQRKISCTGKPKIYQIRFKVAVPIEALTMYTVSAEFDGCFPYPTFYGVNGKRILCLKDLEGFDDKDVTFIFFKTEKSFLDTGGEMGQIPQILFYL
ncbi:hypothetical protein B4U80_10070 [Leptotrombidium deliense]|uniref:BTB domain-containing protein n=1 Tax=Leptotrombidium deliense TaxID=299467 RepID=A0A443SN77_9ACAR|nr:hypothetical protein B4U80_10070 [Leptotrombidium deliense]